MPTDPQFSNSEVNFTKEGAIAEPDQLRAMEKVFLSNCASDTILLAHGWNNDTSEARGLYGGLLGQIRAGLSAGRIDGAPKDFNVMAILWPSKRFVEIEAGSSPAAWLGDGISDAAIVRQISTLQEILCDDRSWGVLDRLKEMVPTLGARPALDCQFADTVRALVASSASLGPEEASESFFSLPGDELMARLAVPVDEFDEPESEGIVDELDSVGGAMPLESHGMVRGSVLPDHMEGSIFGVGDNTGGIRFAARNLMNYATYYQMKERSGQVGLGVNSMLRQLLAKRPEMRVHLVGHSFGARLVTTAVQGEDAAMAFKPHSMVLLQAAFSHNGFAENYDGKGGTGAFRRVLTEKLLQGPAVVTHTRNDRAVGVAYPLASLIARTDSSKLGDERDRYGAMGRNGAQHTPESSSGLLLDVDQKYIFESGRIYNLQADHVIRNHSDIIHPQVAHACIAAMARP